MSDTQHQTTESAVIVRRIEDELKARGIDLYLIVSREDSDPIVARILNAHVVAQTAFLFRANGEHLVLTGRTDAMAYDGYPFFREIIAMEEGFDVEFARVFERLQPKRVALNICEDDPQYDGLRWGLYQQLQEIVGADELRAMEVSSAEMLRAVLQ
tara:strand:- start:1657 stop:2124 length:468 start_codon:yes stop_codon:yes gene_type:complete